MKNLMLSLVTIISFSAPALADTVLQPGEMIKVSGERIYCAGGSAKPTKAYICKCGFANNYYGRVTVLVNEGDNLKAIALQKCKDETAQNSTQEMMMEVQGCRSI